VLPGLFKFLRIKGLRGRIVKYYRCSCCVVGQYVLVESYSVMVDVLLSGFVLIKNIASIMIAWGTHGSEFVIILASASS